MSGVFLAVGLAYWTCAFGIGAYLTRFRLLALLTIVGGLARLASFFFDGRPSLGHQIGLVVELAVVPGLLFWSGRIVRKQPLIVAQSNVHI